MPTLEWIGKDKVVNHHQEVPFMILDKKYTFNAKDSENMIIHGDNLLALKSLLPKYEGLIDCIYIDPPYNTGNEKWVYNDNVNDPRIKKWLGEVVGAEGEDLSRHDKWLCMMYPRLKLLHKLLSEKGVIFISIDDNEQANLKLICDEIFGVRNFIANICHKSRSSISNDLILSPNHNIVLFYAKNIDNVFARRRQFRMVADETEFKLDDNDGKGKYKLVPVDGPGGAAKGNPYYEFLGVTGYWRYSKDTMQELYEKGEIVKRKTSLSRKYYYSKAIEKGGKSYSTWWDDAGSATNGTNLIKDIFNEKTFDTPKPLDLLERIVKISTQSNSIVLDSFAGSGTTAQAVLNINKQDNGKRKFILVEMMDYSDTITAERVKRVINGYGKDDKAVAGIPGDFTYYELGQPLFKDDKNLNEEVPEEEIRKYVYYMETKKPLDTETTDNPYLLGKNNDTAYYFYYKKDEITTLNHEFLSTINTKATEYIIYADKCVLAQEVMEKFNIVFKKIPRDITRL